MSKLDPEVQKLFSWVTIEGNGSMALRLEQPPLKGIIFQFKDVKLIEPVPPNVNLNVNFSYDVLQNPYKKEEIDMKELEKVTGTIIIHLLQWFDDTNKIADNLKE